MTGSIIRKTSDKIQIFRNLFPGLPDVYGTYDPITGCSSQVKAPVTDRVILAHLKGRQPYGVYLLIKDKTRAIAADFDTENRIALIEFINSAKHYDLTAYIERSKSKGYHVWIFFERQGVLALKARMVVCHILDEIEEPSIEVFPKQDVLNTNIRFGNFINAPLFGTLVPQGKTVFVDPTTFQPYSNQWDFLESVRKIKEATLDDIIEMNDLLKDPIDILPKLDSEKMPNKSFNLPACAQKMLGDGVSRYQRVSCFRLAVHLKRLGLPYDVAVAALKVWALKNSPRVGKQVITEREIVEQTSYAFNKDYRGYGCNSEAVAPFCQAECPVNRLKERLTPAISEPSKKYL